MCWPKSNISLVRKLEHWIAQTYTLSSNPWRCYTMILTGWVCRRGKSEPWSRKTAPSRSTWYHSGVSWETLIRMMRVSINNCPKVSWKCLRIDYPWIDRRITILRLLVPGVRIWTRGDDRGTRKGRLPKGRRDFRPWNHAARTPNRAHRL